MLEPRPAPPPPAWTVETKALIEEIQAATPPKEPFWLHPWAEVADPVKFHASVLMDIDHGPGGPRARTGALAQDLRDYAHVLRGGMSRFH